MRVFTLNLVPLFVVGLAFIISGTPAIFFLENSKLAQIVYLGLAPLIFVLVYILVAGIISLPFQRAIVSGVFPRDIKIPVYLGRRVYGVCINAVTNFSLVFGLILQTDFLKKLYFRIFGYEGSLKFTTYQDTWLRDYKLLTFGDGAYLGGGAILGTNIVLSDGNIMVGRVKVLDNSQIGRLCILGPGSRVGKNSEVGVSVIFGIRTRVADNVKINGSTGISHAVEIEDNVTVGEHSYIGTKVKIREGIEVAKCSSISEGVIISTQEDMDNYIEVQNNHLSALLNERLTLLDSVGRE